MTSHRPIHLLCSAAALLLCAAPALAEPGCAAVEVANVRPKQGHLMVAAFNSADSFQKTPLRSLRLPAGDATMRFELCGLGGAEVALTLFQDLDSDGKMNKNIVGLPSEPWGSSGKPGAFGPSWDTGKVALDGQPIRVTLSQ